MMMTWVILPPPSSDGPAAPYGTVAIPDAPKEREVCGVNPGVKLGPLGRWPHAVATTTAKLKKNGSFLNPGTSGKELYTPSLAFLGAQANLASLSLSKASRRAQDVKSAGASSRIFQYVSRTTGLNPALLMMFSMSRRVASFVLPASCTTCSSIIVPPMSSQP